MTNQAKTDLIDFLVKINDKKLMSAVIANLTSPQELHELALRLQIFKGLNDGVSQRTLARQLKVSLATISRGSRELQYGQPGIKKILNND